MNINMNSIMGKVSAYAKSSSGKERMNQCIQQYADKGITQTAAGDKVVNEDMMWQAAEKFLYVMKTTAREYDLPASVMAHIEGMESGGIFKMPHGYEIPLYFFGDLRRESLEDGSDYYGGQFGGNTGEGVDNIVALFNNGYHAKNYVYGWWNDHSPTGESLFRGGAPGEKFAWVRSRKEREALHFIQKAVHDFNNNYGAEYNVTVEVGPAYR